MPEVPSRPSALTLDNLVQTARGVLLRDGYHVPTLIADGTDQAMIAQLPELAGTTEQRQRQLFQLGVQMAASGSVGVLTQAFFISEGWMSVATEDQPPQTPPSQDPKRIEVLLIAQYVVLTQASALIILEMLRDAEGTLTDLRQHLPANAEQTQVSNPLLLAFVAGFFAVQHSTPAEGT